MLVANLNRSFFNCSMLTLLASLKQESMRPRLVLPAVTPALPERCQILMLQRLVRNVASASTQEPRVPLVPNANWGLTPPLRVLLAAICVLVANLAMPQGTGVTFAKR